MLKGRQYQLKRMNLWLIGLAGFLFFWIQPLVGKILLPLVGGAPTMWLVTLFFFQIILLTAYGYVYWLGKKLDANHQLRVHRLLILASGITLPLLFCLEIGQMALAHPGFWLLLRMSYTLGVPLFVLATTSPFLQAIQYSTTQKEPYYLYSVSNFACLLALFLFIIGFEPLLGNFDQRLIWVALYLVYCYLIWKLLRFKQLTIKPIQNTQSVSMVDWGHWLFIAWVINSLLYGVSFYLSDEVVTLPLLWVLPLFIFLLAFVIGFSRFGSYFKRLRYLGLVLGAMSLTVFLLRLHNTATILLHCGAYACLCIVLAARLGACKPQLDALRQFYLAIALGGLLAGLFHLVIAPLMFSTNVEYPASLILALAVICRRWWSKSSTLLILIGIWVGATFAFQKMPNQQLLAQSRNFFGIKRVLQWHQPEAKVLMHGTTIHGAEEASTKIFSTYYQDLSPLFQLIKSAHPQPLTIAVAGLGTGNMACFASNDDELTFIEIDKDVTMLANQWFGFLSKCPPKGGVIHMDARLGIKNFPQHSLDIIVVDVYHSDSIPAHLMTREAINLYLQKLKSNEGYILFHISHRYFDLKPLFYRLAKAFNLHASFTHREMALTDIMALRYAPEWVLLSRRSDIHHQLKDHSTDWQPIQYSQYAPLWTDQYSSLLHPIWMQIKATFGLG